MIWNKKENEQKDQLEMKFDQIQEATEENNTQTLKIGRRFLLWIARVSTLLMLTIIIIGGLVALSEADNGEKVKVSRTEDTNFNQQASILGSGENEKDDNLLTIPAGKNAYSYISEAKKSEVDFWMVGAKVRADATKQQFKMSVRVGSDGQTWGPWQEMDLEKDQEKNNLFYSDPEALNKEARWAQYSIILTSDGSSQQPVIYSVELIYIDPTQKLAMVKKGWEMIVDKVAGKENINVINRKEWGADESLMKWTDIEYAPVKQIIVHHTAGSNNSPIDPAAVVRGIYYFHAVEKDWGDIGYNYLVDQYGNIYEGRKGGLGAVGAHSSSYNYGSVGIALIGNYMKDSPSANMLSGLIDAVSFVGYQADLDLTSKHNFEGKEVNVVAGHRDVNSTECPGDILYGMLPDVATAASKGQSTLPEKIYNAQYVGQSVKEVNLNTGQSQTISVRYKNTGNAMWIKERNDMVLVPVDPYPRNSSFGNGSWVSSEAVGGPSQITVMPGEEVVFNLNLVGIDKDISVTEKFALKGLKGIIDNTQMEIKINNKKIDTLDKNNPEEVVKNNTENNQNQQTTNTNTNNKVENNTQKIEPDLYHAQWVAQSDNVVLFPGEQRTVWLDLKNIGKTPWYKDGDYPVRLGTDNSTDRNSGFYEKNGGWLAPNRVEMLQWSVQPGEVARFRFTIAANQVAGVYKEYFRPVVENVTWMEDMGIYMQIEVSSANYKAELVGQSEKSFAMGTGKTARLWVEIKNTGNVVWRNDGDTPIRLGTDKELDRQSSFYNPGYWISPNRPTGMKKNSIAPGEVARFEINVKAPQQSGKYNESFRLVAENISWLDDLGISWDIEVE